MRVSKEKAVENRARILAAAARLIRERGIAGAGVDALTEAAGMTHGSLYSQFGSKDRLVEEALSQTIAASSKVATSSTSLKHFVSTYLSPDHRNRPGDGCPLAALACEMPRQQPGVRSKYTDGLRGMVDCVQAVQDPENASGTASEQSLATVAALVGALILARAVDDAALSDAILRATREQLVQ